MEKGNRLAGEKSPYLLQHQHNPVDWFPWGKEAFEKAREEGKPIFLSIGYSTCHWCHVMERESFENGDVAAFLNEHFVSIKVDREDRPDVNKIYMTAVQAMGGARRLAVERVFDRRVEAILRRRLFSAANSSAWKKFRRLLAGAYNKILIVSIVANKGTDWSFSSTSIAEA